MRALKVVRQAEHSIKNGSKETASSNAIGASVGGKWVRVVHKIARPAR